MKPIPGGQLALQDIIGRNALVEELQGTLATQSVLLLGRGLRLRNDAVLHRHIDVLFRLLPEPPVRVDDLLRGQFCSADFPISPLLDEEIHFHEANRYMSGASTGLLSSAGARRPAIPRQLCFISGDPRFSAYGQSVQ